MYEFVQRRPAFRLTLRYWAIAAASAALLLASGCGVGSAPSGSTGGGGTPSGTLSASSTSLDLGSITVGSSGSKSLTIANVGNAAITITSISITGTGYSVSGVTTPVSLSPSQNVTATIKFAASNAGVKSGTLGISTDTEGKDLSIPLTATAVAPGVAQLSANPAPVAFGNLTVGSSSSKTVRLSNVGSASAAVGSVSFSGAGFNVSGISAPLSIGSGQSTTFQVSFSPSAAANYSGSIIFKDSTGAALVNLSLTGAGVAAAPHSVTLSWTASTSTVAGYRVYRGSVSGGPYTLVSLSLLGTTSYQDNNVVAGNSYFYVVTAVDLSNIESGFSNEAAVTIPTP